jgi:hypothetical protein
MASVNKIQQRVAAATTLEAKVDTLLQEIGDEARRCGRNSHSALDGFFTHLAADRDRLIAAFMPAEPVAAEAEPEPSEPAPTHRAVHHRGRR